MPQLSIYALDGSLRVGSEAIRLAPPSAVQRGEELLRRGHNIPRCRRTRWGAGYQPYESLGESVARKLAVLGLYNPEVAKAVELRQARMQAACDE